MQHLKTPQYRYIRLLSTPFIISMIVPLVLFNLSVEIYHQICFRMYGIPLLKRSKYIKIDRHELEYLDIRKKIFCVYCGYANGFIHYASEIAGKTEEYWCGIQHTQSKGFIPPKHHKNFIKYGDKAALGKLRNGRQLRKNKKK